MRSVSSDGRFAATPSEILRSSVSSICCVVSSVSSARLLMPASTLVIWHSPATVHGCVHVFHLKINLTVRACIWRYTNTLFADKYFPIYWILLKGFFCGHTYIHFLIVSLSPFCYCKLLANNLRIVALYMRRWCHKVRYSLRH